jgi:hypothetical protein
MRKTNAEFGDKLLKNLSQDQRDKFEKLKGEKFDIDLSTPMGASSSGPGSFSSGSTLGN